MKQKRELKSVLQGRIDAAIKRNDSSNHKTINRIAKDASVLTDMIVPMSQKTVTFQGNGSLLMALKGQGKFGIHENAIRQLGAKFGVPTAYLNDLSKSGEWQRALAAQILNEHTGHSSGYRSLIRTVGMEVRGVLSDSYKRLNGMELMGGFVSRAAKEGAVVYDSHYTDTRMYVEVIVPKLIDIDTEANGRISVAFGARYQNSDFGDGAMEVRTFFLNAVCLNGMVRENIIRKVHLGSRIPDGFAASDATFRKDTAAMASLIQDVIAISLGKEAVSQQVAVIERAATKEVNVDQEIRVLPKLGLSKSEVEQTHGLLLQGRPEDGLQGGATLWKFAQAVTAVGRNIGGDRSRDLAEVGGTILNRN